MRSKAKFLWFYGFEFLLEYFINQDILKRISNGSKRHEKSLGISGVPVAEFWRQDFTTKNLNLTKEGENMVIIKDRTGREITFAATVEEGRDIIRRQEADDVTERGYTPDYYEIWNKE